MSNVGLMLTGEQHRKAAELALMLQSVVMGDGRTALKFNAATRAEFMRWMDELIGLLEVGRAYEK